MEALVMDQRIVWNSKSIKQVDEAKKIIMKYKRMGYEILLASGAKMDKWSYTYEEVLIKATSTPLRTMKILNETGDERMTWNCDNSTDSKKARKKFDDLIAKGYQAYSVDVNGKKNRRITEFDVEAREILMVPKTAKG